jgi:hypothetical protein
MIVIVGSILAAASLAIPAYMGPQAVATVFATIKRARDAAAAAETASAVEIRWITEVAEEMKRPPMPREAKKVAELIGADDVVVLLNHLGRLPAASRPTMQEVLPGTSLLVTHDELSALREAKARNEPALAGQLIRELVMRQEAREKVFGAA